MNTYARLTSYEPKQHSPKWGSDCIEVVRAKTCPNGFKECADAASEFHPDAKFPNRLFPGDMGFHALAARLG